tara:strand:- start:52 stop:498 length:447 start_codon:yes stop_codon:yes gene_type:complete
MDKLDYRLFTRDFGDEKEIDLMRQMKKLIQELEDSVEHEKKQIKKLDKEADNAGFDGRTGLAPRWEMADAEFREEDSEEYYESWNQEAKRRGFDSVEAMREEDNRREERILFLEENSCPACKNEIPCGCGLVDDSDNISRNTKMGSHL